MVKSKNIISGKSFPVNILMETVGKPEQNFRQKNRLKAEIFIWHGYQRRLYHYIRYNQQQYFHHG